MSTSDRAARRKLYDLVLDIDRRRVEGDLVELGVARGGTALILASAADPLSGRNLWLYDSFQGLPEPTLKDGPKAIRYAGGASKGALRSIGKCVGTRI